ncbi:hypothetical protein DPMN_166278 [Dreissena polymorpha]|uniref:Uncharacterized protein n=1 Tax=Dreissena polymorpha TaxID=45954 RepID=A0A9D4EYJ8_DREPO|nr:hypothetical protein DPMN_166278 [Dreissena polymorpha]
MAARQDPHRDCSQPSCDTKEEATHADKANSINFSLEMENQHLKIIGQHIQAS